MFFFLSVFVLSSVSGFYLKKRRLIPRQITSSNNGLSFCSPGKLLLSTWLCQCRCEVLISVFKAIFVVFKSFQRVMTPGVTVHRFSSLLFTPIWDQEQLSISIITAKHFCLLLPKVLIMDNCTNLYSKYVCVFSDSACSLLVYRSHTWNRTAGLFLSLL